MATLRLILASLLVALSCSAQLTLKSAHYPTLFKGSSGSVLPASGAGLWLSPETAVWTNLSGTIAATSLESVRRWDDASGNGNHVYNYTLGNIEGGHFDTGFTLNGKRVMQFGRNCGAAFPNRTGMSTSNNVALNGGFTLFWVGSFLAPCGVNEPAGAWFGYKNFELLARKNPVGDALQTKTYHNLGGVELTDPVTVGTTNWQVWAWTFNDSANTTALYRSNNIVASATDNGALPATGEVSIGFRFDDSVASHLNGGVTEMILFTNALSVTEISNVNVYLLNKYFP